MKKIIINSAIAIIAFAIIFPITAFCQEKKEKKVHVKTVKEIDGKKVVTDTTFVLKDGENKGDIVKQNTWVGEGDSIGTITLDIDVDSDFDGDGENMIIMKSEHHGSKFSTKDGKRKYKIKVIGDEHGEENVFFYDDFDFDVDMDNEELEHLKIIMKEHGDKMKNICLELDGEKLIMLKELDNLKGLEGLEKLEMLKELEHLEHIEGIEDIEIIMPDFHYDIPEHNEYYFHHQMHDAVSDRELREAGIKNKPDRLVVEDFDIDIKDGIVNLDFVLATDGTPKVNVFNYFGDKVYSGKPEIMNGKYVIMINLSAKQHGTYYIQVVQKNTSLTKKLRL
ncbi:MAG: hypothetical protein HQ521_18920 [Bacteroidetes bacterium]|nr:hypothetical protein [Bacteroidota bacterium]